MGGFKVGRRAAGASGLECDDFIGQLLVVLFYVCSRTFLRLHTPIHICPCVSRTHTPAAFEHGVERRPGGATHTYTHKDASARTHTRAHTSSLKMALRDAVAARTLRRVGFRVKP